MSRPLDEARPARQDVIEVRSESEKVAITQLAARWAEAFASEPDSPAARRERFRLAFEYLDAIVHGVPPRSD
jgi:hypothetical protein